MSPTRPALRAALGAVLLAAATFGCGGSDGSTSLLDNPDLQHAAELAMARDGAALARLLRDRHAPVRARAAFELASVQDQQAAPALIDALRDRDAAVRAEAAFALGQLPLLSGAVENALLDRLAQEQDSVVEARVIEALGKLGRSAGVDALARLDPSGPQAAEAALALAHALARGETTPAGLDALAARLTHPSADVRRNAAWGFGNATEARLWQPRRAQVYAALDRYDRADEAASHLLRALGQLTDPVARQRLIEWLSTATDWRNRAAAAEALGGAKSAPEQDELLRALADSSAHVRIAAAAALGAAPLGPAQLDRAAAWIAAHPAEPQAGGALLSALARAGRAAPVLAWTHAAAPDDAVRWRPAIEALGLLQGDDAIRALADASRSRTPAVSGAAVQSLAVRWVQGDRGSAAGRALFYRAFADGLHAKDPITAPLLAEVLKDSVFQAMGSDSVLATVGPVGEPAPAPFVAIRWDALRGLGPAPRLVLETTQGTITLELATEQAPATVQALARVADERRFDGVPFHRVVGNFMIQGGDIARGDGMGDPGFRLPTEITHLRYVRGTAGMARTEKDTETAQFFITHSMQPHLDGGYTAFGRVVDGLEVVDRILEGDRIVHARMQPTAEPPAAP